MRGAAWSPLLSLAGLSLRDLEYLVAVAECRHFGRAAERCGVSQPALSAQVRKLESWLGVTVFERAPGRVLLTGQGAALLNRVQGVLAEARSLVELARAAGLVTAEPGVVSTTVSFPRFDDWWEPFSLGVGPAGAYVAGLEPNHRAALRERCAELLPTAPFTVTVSAWAVTARV